VYFTPLLLAAVAMARGLLILVPLVVVLVALVPLAVAAGD
jgi:hypothetical protein